PSGTAGNERVARGGRRTVRAARAVRRDRIAGHADRSRRRPGAGRVNRRAGHARPGGGLRSLDLLRPGAGVRGDVVRREPSDRAAPGAMGVSAAVGALLALAVIVQLLACVGILVMPNLNDRVHFLGPASTVGPLLVAGAVVIRESLSHAGIM